MSNMEETTLENEQSTSEATVIDGNIIIENQQNIERIAPIGTDNSDQLSFEKPNEEFKALIKDFEDKKDPKFKETTTDEGNQYKPNILETVVTNIKPQKETKLPYIKRNNNKNTNNRFQQVKRISNIIPNEIPNENILKTISSSRTESTNNRTKTPINIGKLNSVFSKNIKKETNIKGNDAEGQNTRKLKKLFKIAKEENQSYENLAGPQQSRKKNKPELIPSSQTDTNNKKQEKRIIDPEDFLKVGYEEKEKDGVTVFIIGESFHGRRIGKLIQNFDKLKPGTKIILDFTQLQEMTDASQVFNTLLQYAFNNRQFIYTINLENFKLKKKDGTSEITSLEDMEELLGTKEFLQDTSNHLNTGEIDSHLFKPKQLEALGIEYVSLKPKTESNWKELIKTSIYKLNKNKKEHYDPNCKGLVLNFYYLNTGDVGAEFLRELSILFEDDSQEELVTFRNVPQAFFNNAKNLEFSNLLQKINSIQDPKQTKDQTTLKQNQFIINKYTESTALDDEYCADNLEYLYEDEGYSGANKVIPTLFNKLNKTKKLEKKNFSKEDTKKINKTENYTTDRIIANDIVNISENRISEIVDFEKNQKRTKLQKLSQTGKHTKKVFSESELKTTKETPKIQKIKSNTTQTILEAQKETKNITENLDKKLSKPQNQDKSNLLKEQNKILPEEENTRRTQQLETQQFSQVKKAPVNTNANNAILAEINKIPIDNESIEKERERETDEERMQQQAINEIEKQEQQRVNNIETEEIKTKKFKQKIKSQLAKDKLIKLKQEEINKEEKKEEKLIKKPEAKQKLEEKNRLIKQEEINKEERIRTFNLKCNDLFLHNKSTTFTQNEVKKLSQEDIVEIKKLRANNSIIIIKNADKSVSINFLTKEGLLAKKIKLQKQAIKKEQDIQNKERLQEQELEISKTLIEKLYNSDKYKTIKLSPAQYKLIQNNNNVLNKINNIADIEFKKNNVNIKLNPKKIEDNFEEKINTLFYKKEEVQLLPLQTELLEKHGFNDIKKFAKITFQEDIYAITLTPINNKITPEKEIKKDIQLKKEQNDITTLEIPDNLKISNNFEILDNYENEILPNN